MPDLLNQRTAIDRAVFLGSILDRIHEGHTSRGWEECAADMIVAGMASAGELRPLLVERGVKGGATKVLKMAKERQERNRIEHAAFSERLAFGMAERARLHAEHDAAVKAGKKANDNDDTNPNDKYVAL